MDRLRQMQYEILCKLLESVRVVAEEMKIIVSVAIIDPRLLESQTTPMPDYMIEAFKEDFGERENKTTK